MYDEVRTKGKGMSYAVAASLSPVPCTVACTVEGSAVVPRRRMGPLATGQMRCIRPVTGNSAKTARCPIWQGKGGTGHWTTAKVRKKPLPYE